MSTNDPSGKPTPNPVDDGGKKNVVAYESFQKALNEKKIAQDAAKLKDEENSTLKTELEAFRQAQKDADEKKLGEQGEYQKIVALREEELTTANSKIAELEGLNVGHVKNLQDTAKLQAFYEELPGRIKKNEYLGFVDLESIVIDPDTKLVDKSSVQNAASKFMENYSDLVKVNDFNGLPGDAPVGGTRKFTKDEWKALGLKDKKENWARRPEL